MKKILMLLSILPMLIACNAENPNDEQNDEFLSGGISVQPYYVQYYINADNIKPVVQNKDGIILMAQGEPLDGSKYCDKFNDNGFNKPIATLSTCAMLNHFVKIELVSDSDFDEAHKAGTSLADIAYFAGGTALPFIESKYDNSASFAWGKDDPAVFKKIAGVGLSYLHGFSPKYIKLQDIDNTSLLLTDPTFGIAFASQPTLSTSHMLTLTATDCNGKQIKTQFEWQSK